MVVSLEVVDFKKEIERVREEAKRLANEDIDARVELATETLRIVTPVDTGKARSGWELEYEKDLEGYTSPVIINDVEYISILNNGHSKQAPKYFIEQTLTTVGLL